MNTILLFSKVIFLEMQNLSLNIFFNSLLLLKLLNYNIVIEF